MRWSEAERQAMAAELVAEAHANDGLAPVDLDQFWADQAVAEKDPFGKDIPQLPIGGLASAECVFAELGIAEDWYRLTHDWEWRLDVCRRYNDVAERIVGKRVLNETDRPADYPEFKQLHDIFEGNNVWIDESYWLQQAADTEDELAALLDRVEARLDDLRAFMLPADWDARYKKVLAAGAPPRLYRGQRGPITFATSIYGAENLVYLILDNPELATRFSDLIRRSMLEMARILDEEAGFAPEDAPHGFGFADDNCYLMTPDMYELFGLPILRAMFERYCPAPEDRRFQHSDSAMGHLLPCLAKVGLNGTNFGPTVMVDEQRKYLPEAVIYGQMAPFTYSRNDEQKIVGELLRDFDMARDSRGLVFTTAGSINNGSRLTGMRLIMAAIQRWCRWD